jgi:hypothetical protein
MIRVLPIDISPGAKKHARAYYCQPCYEAIVENAKDAIPELSPDNLSADQAMKYVGSMLGLEGSPVAGIITTFSTLDIEAEVNDDALAAYGPPLALYYPTGEQLEKVMAQGLKEGMIE